MVHLSIWPRDATWRVGSDCDRYMWQRRELQVTWKKKKKTPPIHCGRQTGFRSGRHLYTAYISYFTHTHTHTPYAHCVCRMYTLTRATTKRKLIYMYSILLLSHDPRTTHIYTRTTVKSWRHTNTVSMRVRYLGLLTRSTISSVIFIARVLDGPKKS